MSATTTYGTVTKAFHWLTALLILTVIPLGVIANDLPYETNEELALKAQLFSFHKTLGVIIFFVALGRIVWALSQTKPTGLHPERKIESFLADLVHWLLYLSLVAVPLTGWIHHAATTGFAPIWLPIGQDLPLVPKDEGVAKLFAGLHWAWSKIMVAAILLHIAGALKHQLIDRDGTLRRMWFGPSAPAAAHRGTWTAPLVAVAVYLAVTGAGAAAGLYTAKPTATAVALKEVSSDWVVQEGEIALTITQFNAPVTGRFADWTAAIRFDEAASEVFGDVTATIAIGSLTLGSVTGQALGADFFDTGSFPTAVFTADIVGAESGYAAVGSLTIKGNTAPVTLPFDLQIDGDSAAMSGSVNLDRRDFGIGDSMADETNLRFGVDVSVSLTANRGS